MIADGIGLDKVGDRTFEGQAMRGRFSSGVTGSKQNNNYCHYVTLINIY